MQFGARPRNGWRESMAPAVYGREGEVDHAAAEAQQNHLVTSDAYID
jgi:hypothetical protein